MTTTELLATILTITGFFLISENIFIWGFALSLTSNVLWVAWASERKASGIIVVNACLAISSINGLMGAI